MNDQELLGLAAKAANIRIKWDDQNETYATCNVHGKLFDDWNPLEDDGDALRLAVKLEIVVEYRREAKAAFAYNYARSLEVGQNNHDLDPYAATRRAIVRAAAEIGREK